MTICITNSKYYCNTFNLLIYLHNMALQFPKKEKRNSPLTVRLKETAVKKLKEIASKHCVSQADVLERLIELEYEEMESGKNRRSKT